MKVMVFDLEKELNYLSKFSNKITIEKLTEAFNNFVKLYKDTGCLFITTRKSNVDLPNYIIIDPVNIIATFEVVGKTVLNITPINISGKTFLFYTDTRLFGRWLLHGDELKLITIFLDNDDKKECQLAIINV